MMDDLELVYEDVDPGRHRRRRKKGRSGLAMILVVVILGALGGGAWYGANKLGDFFAVPDYETAGSSDTSVKVKKGESIADIGNNLMHADVVKSAKAFVNAAKENPDSTKIQPGTYKVRKQMRAKDALAMLLDLKNKITTKVTLREGLTIGGTLDALSKATGIPVADYKALIADPVALGVPDFWFKRNDGKPVEKSIEGFLFPDTYEFEPGFTAESVLKAIIFRFNQEMEALDFLNKVQNERKISPFEALVVASLAQVESGNVDDLGKVARVAYNRAYKKNMPLQFDVTANYWLEKQGKPTKSSSDLTAAELNDTKNPYNTGASSKGLPAGPISNPGSAALKGAMDPPPGDWVFFVAVDKEGHSAFAVTDDEHRANIRKACQAGVLSGDACK
ncbi:endolytic transglycosylase MltG [Longispora albida]|uniref:endolytic transglycosylase MltG n=1 Tax=Longispora albida TaxID=203523 RepID=UPI00036A2755|nr:endolytic transglycosylase MltG [Longispora albida]